MPAKAWYYVALCACVATSCAIMQLVQSTLHLTLPDLGRKNLQPRFGNPGLTLLRRTVRQGMDQGLIPMLSAKELNSHTKITLALTNHVRVQNMHWIVGNATQYDLVDQIVVWDDPENVDNIFEYNHPKVDIVRAPEFQMFQHWGMMGRFKLALATSRNEQILIQDDDEQLLESAMQKMIKTKAQDPDRLVCAYAREVSQPQRPYTVSYYMPDVKAPSHPPVCLTKALLTDRRFCLEMVRLSPLMEDVALEGTPYWNGEDIFNSLAAIRLTGKLHTVLPIDRREHFVLPAPDGISDKKGENGSFDHVSFRKKFTAIAAERLNLTATDLFKQRKKATGIIPSRLTTVGSLLPQVKPRTFTGTTNICLMTLLSSDARALETAVARNQHAYAQLNGYNYRVHQGRISGDELFNSAAGNLSTPTGGAMDWQKITAIKNMLKEPTADGKHDLCAWVMWLEPDAVFTNFNKTVEPIIARYKGENTAIFPRHESSQTVLDTGVFFVRNSLGGLRMLDTLAGMYSEYKTPSLFHKRGAQDAFHDYVFQQFPDTPKYGLNVTYLLEQKRLDIAMAPQKLFNAYYSMDARPSAAGWKPCDLIARVRGTDAIKRIEAVETMETTAKTCIGWPSAAFNPSDNTFAIGIQS